MKEVKTKVKERRLMLGADGQMATDAAADAAPVFFSPIGRWFL